MDNLDLISSPAELWHTIKSKGGLDVKNYDAPIVSATQIKLGLPQSADLSSQLEASSITIPQFLEAFFQATRPYSAMMTDLLKMFQSVGVKHSGKSLAIEYDFGKDSGDFSLLLEDFKNFTSIWEEVSRMTATEQWTLDSLWTLNRALQSLRYVPGDYDLSNWLQEYRSGIWPDKLPQPANTGTDDLDGLLFRVWNVLNEVYTVSSTFSQERQKLHAFTQRESMELGGETEDVKLQLYAQIDRDRWAESTLQGLFSQVAMVSNEIKNGSGNSRLYLKQKLESVFSQVEVKEELRIELIERTLEFLDLPVWKKRHELYATWVSTVIAEAVGHERLRIHKTNDTLKFSFSGTHFATLDDGNEPMHIWSELRSPLATPISKKRKKAIQPDYTILRAPISSPESAILVVECKQYKRSSKKNFLEALIDYANGRPNAKIILVNYGPVNNAMIQEAPLNLQARLVAVGEMRPYSAIAFRQFQTEVREALLPATLPKSETAPDTERLKFELSWTSPNTDLDLHLCFRNESQDTLVSYMNPGSIDRFPWMQLQRDIHTAGLPEIIEIFKFETGEYLLSVHNYNTLNSISNCQATVRFKMNGVEYALQCPTDGIGQWWQVANFNLIANTVSVINKVSTLSLHDDRVWNV